MKMVKDRLVSALEDIRGMVEYYKDIMNGPAKDATLEEVRRLGATLASAVHGIVSVSLAVATQDKSSRQQWFPQALRVRVGNLEITGGGGAHFLSGHAVNVLLDGKPFPVRSLVLRIATDSIVTADVEFVPQRVREAEIPASAESPAVVQRTPGVIETEPPAEAPPNAQQRASREWEARVAAKTAEGYVLLTAEELEAKHAAGEVVCPECGTQLKSLRIGGLLGFYCVFKDTHDVSDLFFRKADTPSVAEPKRGREFL